jgi:1,4-dihydroxy-6-naphthoate synthase
MKIKIAISPCPNDTFIFEKIYTKQLHIDGIEFEFYFLDIEELNKCAIAQSMDIIKISYAQYFSIKDNYNLLNSGGAMGYGVGPLLLKKKDTIFNPSNAHVAIPGVHTSANFLLSYLYPQIKNKTPMLFSKIEDALLNNEFDAGLVIHESRFTYAQKGLEKIEDLGLAWHQNTNLPIPLGCIVAQKKIDLPTQHKIERLIQDSIPNFNEPIILSSFIKSHAQEMEEDVMRQHIQLYVNEFSKHIGEQGKKSIGKMEAIYLNIHK